MINEAETLFYKGTKVLLKNFIYLKKALIKFENDKFDYNFILEIKSTPSEQILKKPITVAFFVFLFGLSFSSIIIFLRSSIENKN